MRSDTSATKTVNMARASATLPRVEGPTKLALQYSQTFLDRNKRRTHHKGPIRKFFEILDPRAWTLAYVVSVFLLFVGLVLVLTGFRTQGAKLNLPIFPVEPLNQMLTYGLAQVFSLTLFTLHFTLNYRSRGRGRIFKAYWYAGWALSLSFLFLPKVQGAFSRHHTNRINEYCFVSKKADVCTRAITVAHKGMPAEVLKLLPETKRSWVENQFKKLDPPLVDLGDEVKPLAKLKGRRLASPVPLPH